MHAVHACIIRPPSFQTGGLSVRCALQPVDREDLPYGTEFSVSFIRAIEVGRVAGPSKALFDFRCYGRIAQCVVAYASPPNLSPPVSDWLGRCLNDAGHGIHGRIPAQTR